VKPRREDIEVLVTGESEAGYEVDNATGTGTNTRCATFLSPFRLFPSRSWKINKSPDSKRLCAM